MADLPWMAEAIERRPVAALVPYARNSRTHSPESVAQLAAGMREWGWTYPVLVDEDDGIIAGHGRVMAAQKLGLVEVPVIVARGWDEQKKRAYVLWDNKSAEMSGWDSELLKIEIGALQTAGFDLSLTGFSASEFAGLGIEGFFTAPAPEALKVKLSDAFGVAPFSVLNAREGWWQARKRAWLALGIQSEVGRGENLLKMSDTMLEPDPEKRKAMKAKGRESAAADGLVVGITDGAYRNAGAEATAASSGTSIFDPVLCELSYRWFSPVEGRVLDPFAGGSVRGIVAAKLKRAYTGVDLRPEQVEANQAQAGKILTSGDPPPRWVVGDSAQIADLVEGDGFDFIFSCPPYLWLEVYSDNPRDLSTMSAAAFEKAYAGIISSAAAKLAPNRFACFVVGDVRDKKGMYVDFPGMTIRAFEKAGLRLYNDAILVTAAGSLPLRVRRQFETGRKLGTTHQRVLVFVKGDPRKAVEAIGRVEFGEIEGADSEEARASDVVL